MSSVGNIVNLNDLVPGLEGKTFQITRGDGVTESYHVPGDLDSKHVFEFLALFGKLVEFQAEAAKVQADAGDDAEKQVAAVEETMEKLQALNEQVKAKLLVVFQISNPELKSLPFGAQTTTAVLGQILEMMGIGSPPEELPSPPAKRTPVKRQPQDRKPRARKTKSTTS